MDQKYVDEDDPREGILLAADFISALNPIQPIKINLDN